MSVNEVMTEIEKDTPFYRRSGGGVTATGGEPLMQADFTAELLKHCRRKGIHTAVETCGYSTWNAFEKVLRYVDLVLYDIKHMDSAQHKKQTRVGNEVILENARKCAALGKEMIIRVPVVPGYNDSSESMKAIAEFARSLEGVEEVHLLPFHRLGESKYDRLGMRYSLKGVKGLDRESLAEQETLIASYDLRVQVGG